MAESKSTDKLLALNYIVDKALDKLPPEKVSKIKKLEVVWVDFDEKEARSDHPLPELKLEFYD